MRSKETLKQWNATGKKIAKFLKEKLKIDDIDLSDIEYCFAQKFYNYLVLDRFSLSKMLQSSRLKT
ncbi:phage integrase SAM-like domain-containing protein [Pedobacter sp. MC2016-05]|uniref:phage integrase SAM-like domain-containing protein n=1 Tax=Pedobacter sp. MC2016-05 TaxID=2994474 RepID=UPI003A5230E5